MKKTLLIFLICETELFRKKYQAWEKNTTFSIHLLLMEYTLVTAFCFCIQKGPSKQEENHRLVKNLDFSFFFFLFLPFFFFLRR